MSFEADDKHVYDLFTKRCYGTPRNQRQYVWNKRNWQELFDDVLLVATGKEATHFIGSIVLYKENDRKNGISYFTIVDGQQRIISLTIFLASVAFCLHCYEFDDEFRGTKQYLFTRDDLNQETMVIKSEQYIALERIITGLFSISPNMAKCFETVALVKQYSRNNKNLAAAFVFFINSIYKHIEESTLSPIQVLLNLRTAITDNLLYVDITASSEEDAYTIFEILNARGSALEGHELLKNFILRGIRPDGDVDTAKTTWSEIESLLGNNIERFVKHYATHKYRTSVQEGVSDYKLIRDSNKGIPTVPLLDDIYQKSIYYNRLLSPSQSEESANCSNVEFKVYAFFKKHRQEQIRLILLSLIHQYELGHLSQEKYEETLLFLYDFFICYTIIGQENSNKITNAIYKNSSILENHYSDSALECFISELKNKLPSKEVFLKAFSNLGWSHHAGYYDDDRNKERVQVVLEVLERYKCASKQCAAFTIEHILDDTNSPENGIIGNLIPLEDSLNSRCNGKDFASKLKIYETSMFHTARNIAQRYAGKSTIDINERTNIMALDFYDHILKSSICSVQKNTNDTKIRKQGIETKSTIKKTIGNMMKNANQSMSENDLPDVQQLSFL